MKEETLLSCHAVSDAHADFERNSDMTAVAQTAAKRHPCYSQDAHHYFARMHVAVAPRCNIQCKYCNRKFDCVNESRPGVTSEVLSPERASQKTLAVGAMLKNLTVVGIAGPGDPLANAKQTFDTFSLIHKSAPDLQLCLSTNGLMLNDYIEEICNQNIHHVTVTVNAIDAHVSEQIYQFVRWRGKTLHGLEAAEVLLQNQMTGIAALIAHGVLVKVNSVLIPGVNDEHMVEVSKKMREMGVFLHNIMPLIIANGSLYHKTGMSPTSATLLRQVQEQCEAKTQLMRHCRQCRADAIGLLGDDRSGELTHEALETMAPRYSIEERAQAQVQIEQRMDSRNRVLKNRALNRELAKMSNLDPFFAAVVSTGDGIVNEHFGHAKEFQIYKVSQEGIHFVTARRIDQYCSHEQSCSDHDDRLDAIADLIADCSYVMSMRMGREPISFFSQRGIEPIMAYGLIEHELYRLAHRACTPDKKTTERGEPR